MERLKFFTDKQFITLCKSIEVMIETKGNNAISPEKAARRLDEMLFESKAPALENMGQIFNLLEWVVPPLVLKFPPFSKLSIASRKAVVNRIIGSSGMFKDLARALKVMASVAYYSSPEAYNEVGYVHFEERERFTDSDTAPSIYLNIENHV
jgi:hypothetical protein